MIQLIGYSVISGVIVLYIIFLGFKKIKKLKRMQKNQKGIPVYEDIECCICMENIKFMGDLNCGHKFCINCISEWFEQNSTCPICRSSILTII
jgi:hypothetical protein